MKTTPARFVVVPERRPMFTRDWNISQRFSGWLVARNVSPNLISILGMAGAIVSGAALAATRDSSWPRVFFLIAVGGIIVRGMGNLLDGMVAVSSGRASPYGELFNEIPDRVSDIAILAGAGCALGGNASLGFIAALLSVLVAYIRAEGKVAGAAQHYCGPMAKPQRMLVVLLISLWCGLAPASCQPTLSVGGQHCGLMGGGLALIVIGAMVTAIRRLHKIGREVEGKPYPLHK